MSDRKVRDLLAELDRLAVISNAPGVMSLPVRDMAESLRRAVDAPDTPQIIDGMTEEWGVSRANALFPVREEEHPMGAYFTPDRAEAEGVRDRMAKLNPNTHYRLVRLLVGPVEVTE